MEHYLIHCELRPSSQHCQEGTSKFLEQAIALARQDTLGKLLVRMDAGNDDGENLRRLRSAIQDLMYFAARLTRHAHRWGLALWRSNPWRSIWEGVYARFRRLATPATG